MNRNLAIGISVVVLLVVAGMVVLPYVIPKTSMTVTFYDDDDNVIWSASTSIGLFDFAFTYEEDTVTKFRVDINWVCSNYESDSVLAIQGIIDVRAMLDVPINPPVGTDSWSSAERTESTGNMWTEFTLADFIEVEDTGKTYGWIIKVTATLKATESAPDGTVRGTATPWSDHLYFDLDWEEGPPPAGFSIVGLDFGFTPTP